MGEKNQFEIIRKGFGYRILTFLYNNRTNPEIYGSMIAKNSPISETNISPVLKRMEKLGIVKRVVNDKSKRTKYLSLTREGIKLVELIIRVDNLLNKLKGTHVQQLNVKK